MKIKTLALAVAMAATGTAHAAINPGTPDIAYSDAAVNSELFLTVFDPSAEMSYHLDLGLTMTQMVDNPTASLSYDLASDANFSAFLGQTDLRYTVTGAFRRFADTPDIPYYGLLTTSATPEAGLFATMPDFQSIADRQSRVSVMANNLNTDAGMGQTNFAENNSGVSVLGDVGYYGQATWGDTVGGSGYVASGNVDSSLAFYHLHTSGVDYNTTIVSYFGDWMLTSTGQLTYGEVSAVPVPAAAWLFGSGLLGLVGVARRKNAIK